MTPSGSFAAFCTAMLFPTLLGGQPVKEIDWKYEINLMGKELAQRHCDLFFQTDSATFFMSAAQIAQEADAHSLFEISVKLQQLLSRMGDAQTRINYHFNIDPGSILPFDCYWFEDGIFVLGTTVPFRELLGKRLVAINGYPLQQVVDSLSTLLVKGNPYLVRAQLPAMITWSPLLEYFGFNGPEGFVLQVEDGAGALTTATMPLPTKDEEEIRVQTDHLPLGWEEPKTFFRDQYFPEERSYYIQYNRCWSREVEETHGSGASALFMPSFKEFEKKVFQTIKREKIDKFVFDMRFNGGGNADQGSKFIKKLSRASFNGDGDFYVIVGRETSGAAIINTYDFLSQTNALLLGEGTGGKPNHYGDVGRFVLPESNLVVNYSTRYFTLEQEEVPFITPDIPAPIHFREYVKGIDPAMEAISDL